MAQVYVGNVDPRVTTSDLEREFQCFGDIRTVTVPRKSPGGYAFVEFKDRRDALYAIGAWSGKHGWRVELSRKSQTPAACNGNGRGGGSGGRFNCYNCGETGHFARDCLFVSKLDKKQKGVILSQRGRKMKDSMASTSAWKPIPPPPPPWQDLPEDIMARILQKLGPIDIIENARKVCTTWRRICKDPAMWRVINMSKFDDAEEMLYDLDSICRCAVDLSQGQLTEINIESFVTEELLQYMSNRSGQLKCLRIACGYEMSSAGFSEAVRKLPLLEELHLQFSPINEVSIENVGKCCPKLKSFTLNDRGCRRTYPPALILDSEALAIAKTMPELRYLSLFGNKMTKVGLEAILDGCPKLETLDLRQCFNIDLNKELEERCAQQLKVVKRPNDSTEDCDWDTEVLDWEDYELDGFSDMDSYYDYDDYDDFGNPFIVDGSDDYADMEEALFGFY